MKEITTGNADSILASLYRTILIDLNIDEAVFNYRLAKYCIQQKEDIKNNNIQKELSNDKMTWKVFLKGLKVLNVLRFDFMFVLNISNEEIVIMVSSSDNDQKMISQIFNIMLMKLKVDESRFDWLLRKYIQNTHLSNNLREESTVRGSIKKELLRDSMSWKTFINKGLRFLQIPKFDLYIRLHFVNKTITDHSKTIWLDHIEFEYEQNEG